jgi:hypothetical protein
MITPRLFSFLLVCFVLGVSAEQVSARAPPEVPGTSSSNCVCYNGGLRRTDVVDRCACACNGQYVGPFCSEQASDYAAVVVTYENTSSSSFPPLDTVEKKLRDGLGASTLDVRWLARLPAYELGTAEVCVLYRISAPLLDRLFGDVASASKPVYLTAPTALDVWMTGLRDAPASRMSQHFASADVLGEHDLSGLGLGDVFGSRSRPTLVINARHLEFFIGALCVLVAVPLLEGLLLRFWHPSESELDAEHRKHATPGTAMSKALDSKRKATAARFAEIAAKNAGPTQQESTTDDAAVNVNPLGGLKSKMNKRRASGVFNFASLSSMGGAKAGSVNTHDNEHDDETPPDAFSG